MPEESTSKVFQLYRLAYSLIFCRSLQEILQSAVTTVSKTLQARNAILWQFSAKEGSLTPAQSILEDKSVKTKSVSLGSDYLGEVFRSGKAMFLTAEALQQPNKHVQLPKELRANTALCVPFKGKPELEGVLEVINKTDANAFTEDDAEYLTKALELVGVAASNMRSQEEQSRNQLNAITRLTLLYDISQIFNSTLELNNLLPIITEKIRDILDADTCTIWLLDEKGERISSAKSTGGYEQALSTYSAALADDIAGEIIQHGEGVLLEDASDDERLKKRFSNSEEFPVYTYMAAPLECKGKILGTLEVINRLIEEPYNEEDQFLLNDLSHQAAISIHNANLLQAERKAKELDTLLTISHEITSTLNLDRVLKTIVNQAATLIPYERAAIALIERNKVDLAAVSGKLEIDKSSDEMRELKDILTWASGLGKGLYVSEFNGKIVADREETKEKFKKHFEKSGAKAFVSIPLKDEEGDVGILSFESGTPYFLDERHLEVASILANQATVAIRNALLYKQVPLMGFMQPLMQRKARLMKMPRERRIAWGIGLGVLALLLIFVPWNMKVVGDATVLPARRTPVVSEVEGLVRQVNFREGDRVHRGDPLATLVDNDYKLALQEQQMRHDVLIKQISTSQMEGDLANARLRQLQLEQTKREIEFYKYQLSRTSITAPVNGVLITPRVEEKVGYLLKKGEPFCELADMNQPRAEIFLNESDAGFLKDGQKVKLKMNAFPTENFYGTVRLLGAQLVPEGQNRYYRVEARVENPRLVLKSGMAGKAKVEVGYHSIGYVLLRKPVGFLWKKLWVWF